MVPDSGLTIGEESDEVHALSDGLATAVSGSFSSPSNHTLEFLVGRAICPCTSQDYLPAFFSEWKRVMQDEYSFSLIDLGQYAVEATHPTDGKGIFRFFIKENVIYLVFVGSEIGVWDQVRSTAQSVLDSFVLR